jgi:hypothetical protein
MTVLHITCSDTFGSRTFATGLLLIAGATALAFGPEGGGYDLSWSTIDGGGGTPGNGSSSGGGFVLSGTIGQPDATPGNVLTGVSGRNTYTLTGGFWAVPAAPSNPCPADLNQDGIVDGADLGLLLGNWDLSGLGDITLDGVVDGADLGLLLGAWGDCP